MMAILCVGREGERGEGGDFIQNSCCDVLIG